MQQKQIFYPPTFSDALYAYVSLGTGDREMTYEGTIFDPPNRLLVYGRPQTSMVTAASQVLRDMGHIYQIALSPTTELGALLAEKICDSEHLRAAELIFVTGLEHISPTGQRLLAQAIEAERPNRVTVYFLGGVPSSMEEWTRQYFRIQIYFRTPSDREREALFRFYCPSLEIDLPGIQSTLSLSEEDYREILPEHSKHCTQDEIDDFFRGIYEQLVVHAAIKRRRLWAYKGEFVIQKFKFPDGEEFEMRTDSSERRCVTIDIEYLIDRMCTLPDGRKSIMPSDSGAIMNDALEKYAGQRQ